MYSGTLSAIAMLLAIRPVLADFKVFCGRDQNGLDGIAANACIFSANPLDCGDVDESIFHYTKADVSFSGVACDGCDAAIAIRDWDVTRLEVNIGNSYFDNGGDHFTIYKGDGGGTMYDTNMNAIGTCSIPADPQNTDCSTPISNSAFKNIYDCVSSITYLESPN